MRKILEPWVLSLLLLFGVADAFAQQTGGEPLHLVTVGSGSPKIVVLHGGPGFRHNYLRPEWDQLSDLGQVVYYDQRGCGRSTHRGPHAWTQRVSDLDSLLTAISPHEPVVLAGSSWGLWVL